MTTLLAIDIGNTNVSLGIFDYAQEGGDPASSGRLAQHWRLSTHREQTSDELSIALRALFSQEARDLLAEKGYDPHYGARPLKRTIQRMLEDPLAVHILDGDFPEGSKIWVGARMSGDALEFRSL